MEDHAVSIFSNIVTGLEELKDDSKELDGILIVIDEIHYLKDLTKTHQSFC